MGNILLFELAFRLLTLPLLLQAVAALFRLSVRASGYSYVTVSNLGFLPAAAGYDRDSGFDGSDPAGGSFHRGGGTSGGISGGGTLAENERFFDVCGRHPSDGIRDPKAESEVVSGAGGSRPGASFILIYRMLCHVKAVKFILPALLAENWGRLYWLA